MGKLTLRGLRRLKSSLHKCKAHAESDEGDLPGINFGKRPYMIIPGNWDDPICINFCLFCGIDLRQQTDPKP